MRPVNCPYRVSPLRIDIRRFASLEPKLRCAARIGHVDDEMRISVDGARERHQCLQLAHRPQIASLFDPFSFDVVTSLLTQLQSE